MPNSRRQFIKMAGLSLGAVLLGSDNCFSQSPIKGKRPNIVWLISEDNSQHFCNIYNRDGVDMPNVNKLAGKGVIFDHAFSNCPVCSAARSTLITGCYPNKLAIHYHRKYQPVELPDGLKPFPAYLKQAGYYTSYFRKTDFNFNWGKDVFDSNKTWQGRQPGQPFFHQHQFAITHEGPLQKAGKTGIDNKDIKLPPHYPDTEVFRKTYNQYYKHHEILDEQIGEMVAKLEAQGVLEDTFIFYFGDHGGVTPRSKGYLYETGLHVPMVMRIPANFRHLIDLKAGTRFDGFVNFIDMAPTALNLAGVKIPELADGKPFLGPKVDIKAVARQDEAYGIADRFDEKYDMVRTVRKGQFKYHRNYQGFNFDALQNNYRYKMIAYQEWRELYKAGKLNEVQSQFFLGRDPETLFDVVKDPYEVKNLAKDPAYRDVLAQLRGKLQNQAKALPDLSFFPESYLCEHAFGDPIAFGIKNKGRIAELIDVADLALEDYDKAKAGIDRALADKDPFKRYWALIVCSCFGNQAADFYDKAKAIAEKDDNELVKVRAAEFLGLTGAADPRPTIMKVLAETDKPLVALITLNTVVMLTDGKAGWQFNITDKSVKAKDNLIDCRVKLYLAAEK
ncbi:MAG: sulfatase-like hydrolase/transferase [Phycisphaerae bacterium]|nr:sulfatase-like hydrolase/transferase [Phycisphaerae bacterium]